MNKWYKKSFGPNALHSFIFDPILLILFGAAMVWIAVRKLYKRFGRKKMIIWILALLILTVFWAIAGALYLDRLNMPFLGEAGQGNHFMWNSGLDWLFGIELVDTAVPTSASFFSPLNILALFIFVVCYPLFLRLGIEIGFLLFGRNEKQTGFIDFFKP